MGGIIMLFKAKGIPLNCDIKNDVLIGHVV